METDIIKICITAQVRNWWGKIRDNFKARSKYFVERKKRTFWEDWTPRNHRPFSTWWWLVLLHDHRANSEGKPGSLLSCTSTRVRWKIWCPRTRRHLQKVDNGDPRTVWKYAIQGIQQKYFNTEANERGNNHKGVHYFCMKQRGTELPNYDQQTQSWFLSHTSKITLKHIAW
jgi:hypothetical protein